MFIQRTKLACATTLSSQPLPVPNTPPIISSVADSQLPVYNVALYTTQPQLNDCFSDMAAHHMLSALEDEMDHKPIATTNVIRCSVKLVELFNFADSHWVQVYENAVQQSFDEKLELYELLDLDAEGEEEANVDVDDSTGELLIG
jgi:hypothetical protein